MRDGGSRDISFSDRVQGSVSSLRRRISSILGCANPGILRAPIDLFRGSNRTNSRKCIRNYRTNSRENTPFYRRKTAEPKMQSRIDANGRPIGWLNGVLSMTGIFPGPDGCHDGFRGIGKFTSKNWGYSGEFLMINNGLERICSAREMHLV